MHYPNFYLKKSLPDSLLFDQSLNSRVSDEIYLESGLLKCQVDNCPVIIASPTRKCES